VAPVQVVEPAGAVREPAPVLGRGEPEVRVAAVPAEDPGPQVGQCVEDDGLDGVDQ
jgi:hypothetical protein